jgi:hypothetical protein
MAVKGILLLGHPPYLPDLSPADFFLFRRVKEALTGVVGEEGWYCMVRHWPRQQFLKRNILGLGRPQKCLGKEHHHRRLLHSFSTVV